MGRNLAWVIVGLVVTACGDAAVTTTTTIVPPGTETIPSTTTAAAPDATTVTSLPAGREGTTTTVAATTTTATAPVPGGDPAEAWDTAPLGFAATPSLRIAHGSLGFLAIDHSPQGAVVRVSDDGRQWRETGVLRGPGGEEEVDVAGLAVTGDEYVVAGQFWSPAAGEASPTRSAVWRSPDGSAWEASEVGYVVSDVLATAGGLALVGNELSAGGTLLGSVVEVEEDGRWIDIAATRIAFAGVHSADGGAAVGDGAVVWGQSQDGVPLVWHSPDLDTWVALQPPADVPVHAQGAARLGEDVVVFGPAHVWRLDGVRLARLASPEAFALDAASGGFAEFREVTGQDGMLVAAAEMVEKAGMAWCLADPGDCFNPVATALVSADGRAWRRIPLPGGSVAFDDPYEMSALVVGGRLAVVHEVAGEVVLSILTDPTASVPIDAGAAPDLGFPVAEPGIDLEDGLPHGLHVWTHCGMPNIGPYNGTYWVAQEVFDLRSAKDQNEFVSGFVEREADRIVFRIGDPETGRTLAVYAPDPEAGETGCY